MHRPRPRLARWFLPVHGDLHVGGRYQLEGQAGGTITACEAPHALDATWEYGGDVSWIELRLSPDGDGARLDLTHVFHPDDEHWPRYGPAATGIGWDLGLVGLAWHFDDGGTPHGECRGVGRLARGRRVPDGRRRGLGADHDRRRPGPRRR